MKLYRPVKTNRINQSFGENIPCAKTRIDGSPVRPFQISQPEIMNICPIGTKKFYPLIGLRGHNGIDWAAYYGEPVYHSGDFEGWMRTEIDKDGGVGVRIVSNNPQIDKKHVQIVYWHLQKVEGYDKKPIKPGDLIGYADSTGASSGDHLHWAPKYCDEKGKTLDNTNGYTGAFDPSPYLENIFILDYLKIPKYDEDFIKKLRSLLLVLKLFLK